MVIRPVAASLPFDPLRACFDRAVRTVKEYNEKMEYIYLNPVKAGLVVRPEEWPWSSVHDYRGSVQRALATPSGLSVDRVLLPADQNTRI
jgi:hypothetical protein